MGFSLEGLSCTVLGRVIFKNASYTFEKKGIHFLVGANGAGKSTVLNFIRGHIEQYSFVEGWMIHGSQRYDLSQKKRPKVGYVVQRYADMLVPTLSVRQNLQAARLQPNPGFRSLPDIQSHMQQLSELRINPEQSLKSLSGGQQQILAIMMALSHELDILLLDEPTAALDEENTDLVMGYLERICVETSCSLLMVSHDQKLIERSSPEMVHKVLKHAAL